MESFRQEIRLKDSASSFLMTNMFFFFGHTASLWIDVSISCRSVVYLTSQLIQFRKWGRVNLCTQLSGYVGV